MCTMSLVLDDFNRRHEPPNIGWANWPPPSISRVEFDALRAEVAELKKLLIAAKRFDEATGQPDCEQADKVALLKQIAKAVGVDLSELLTDAAGEA